MLDPLECALYKHFSGEEFVPKRCICRLSATLCSKTLCSKTATIEHVVLRTEGGKTRGNLLQLEKREPGESDKNKFYMR